jgi:bacteriocin-like protein
MNKHRTNAINTSATSKQVREPMDRELTADELEHITGGNTKGSGAGTKPGYMLFDLKEISITSVHSEC